jgi:hypothetical protein
MLTGTVQHSIFPSNRVRLLAIAKSDIISVKDGLLPFIGLFRMVTDLRKCLVAEANQCEFAMSPPINAKWQKWHDQIRKYVMSDSCRFVVRNGVSELDSAVNSFPSSIPFFMPQKLYRTESIVTLAVTLLTGFCQVLLCTEMKNISRRQLSIVMCQFLPRR